MKKHMEKSPNETLKDRFGRDFCLGSLLMSDHELRLEDTVQPSRKGLSPMKATLRAGSGTTGGLSSHALSLELPHKADLPPCSFAAPAASAGFGACPTTRSPTCSLPSISRA